MRAAALILLAAVRVSVPRLAADPARAARPGRPRVRLAASCAAARSRRGCSAVEFFFNFFYMPIEVALPLYVHRAAVPPTRRGSACCGARSGSVR